MNIDYPNRGRPARRPFGDPRPRKSGLLSDVDSRALSAAVYILWAALMSRGDDSGRGFGTRGSALSLAAGHRSAPEPVEAAGWAKASPPSAVAMS